MILSSYDQSVLSETYAAIQAETGFSPEDLRSRRRTSELVIARFIAIAVVRKRSRLKLKAMGVEFGRDHSSIIHALHEIDNWMTSPHRYISVYLQLKKIDDTVVDRMNEHLLDTEL